MTKLIFTGTFMLAGLGAFSAQELETPKMPKVEATTVLADSAKVTVEQSVQEEKAKHAEWMDKKTKEAKNSEKKRKKPSDILNAKTLDAKVKTED